MAFAPDGRLFFAEKDTGDIRVIEDGHLLPDPFAHIDVLSAAEQGLLGLALDPAFDTDPWVYVYYSDPVAHINRLARLRADGGSVGTCSRCSTRSRPRTAITTAGTSRSDATGSCTSRWVRSMNRSAPRTRTTSAARSCA